MQHQGTRDLAHARRKNGNSISHIHTRRASTYRALLVLLAVARLIQESLYAVPKYNHYLTIMIWLLPASATAVALVSAKDVSYEWTIK